MTVSLGLAMDEVAAVLVTMQWVTDNGDDKLNEY